MLNDPQSALSALSGKPVRADVVAGLKSAAEKTGVSFDFLVAEATRESGLDPKAKAPTTSARGLFQFTSQTWLEVFKANGAKYGQADLAKKIKRSDDGSLGVADDKSLKTILDMRQDPEMSALMAAEYALSNEKRLENRLGRDVGPSDLYLAHFLGPNGAARFIDVSEKSPETVAAKLMPAAARHNRSVFYDGARPRTVAGVYDQVKNSINGSMQRLAQSRGETPPLPTVASQNKDEESLKLAAAQADAQTRQETARLALMSQLSQPTGLAGEVGAESPSGFATPKVSLPMPPPLSAKTSGHPASDADGLEGLMRKVRLSLLG